MLHYHGTPITPRAKLQRMAGRSFCVSFAHPSDVEWVLSHGQSVMLDNGAFSLHTKEKAVDWHKFYDWVEPKIGGANWAVVPDVIRGTVYDNMRLISQWPHRRDCAAVVWHMHEPLRHLLRLCDLGFGKICFGSSGDFWEVGSMRWEARVDAAFNELARRGPLPWVHMMRGLSMAGGRWPFASADSVNVGRNFKDYRICPDAMARRIDAVQCPVQWKMKTIQGDLFGEIS